jgi:hypothetical protein
LIQHRRALVAGFHVGFALGVLLDEWNGAVLTYDQLGWREFPKGYEVMFDRTRSMARTQGNGHGAYYIRLNLDHPDLHQARGLLSACGACEVVEATEMVHRFMTMVGRDSALDLVRRTIGYTVANSFDGHPWLRGEQARRCTVESMHGRDLRR